MEIQAPLKRLQTINAYNAMIIDRAMRGWQPYFANFMFDHIPGKKATKFEIMEDEVERVYATLITHVVRRPNAPSQMEYRPFFVGCPDAPVAKSNKPSIRVHLANDGWHFNGCLLLPPPDKCRMKGHLDEHFRQHKDHYYIPDRPLNCVHVTRMSSPAIADYTFKHYKRGNVASGDILLLPRSRDEISARPKSNTVNSSVMSTAACGSKCSEKNRMGKIEKAKESAEESQVHPGYLVVSRLEDVWDANLLDFDPAAVGKPNMSKAELNKLLRAFKKVRKALRLSIGEVAALIQA